MRYHSDVMGRTLFGRIICEKDRVEMLKHEWSLTHFYNTHTHTQIRSHTNTDAHTLNERQDIQADSEKYDTLFPFPVR